jgi:uncharacterized membrane protein
MDETTRLDAVPPPPPPPPAPPASPPASTGVTLQRPFIVGLLFVLNIVLGFSAIVGVILAYVWRADRAAQEWEKTHYTYLIRTFWIGFALGIGFFAVWFGSFFALIAQTEAGPPPNQPPPAAMFVWMFGAMGVMLLGMIWVMVRAVLSLAKSSNCTPMPRPKTWWF